MKIGTQSAHRSIELFISVRATALVFLFVLTSAAALADKPPVTRVAKVSLTGLDLSTPEGAHAAYERIKAIAKTLCFQLSDSRKIDDHALYGECFTETVGDAMQRLHSPTVAAVEK
jgi:UrcA family protein